MVQRGGGCCIARYAGGGAYDVSKMDRILLRFRPIAPKPASVSRSASGSDSTVPENSTAPLKRGSGRRRRGAKDGSKVIVNKRNNRKKEKKISSEKADSGGSVTGGVKTLTLLPATPVVKEAPMISFEENGGHAVDPVVGSWVKVECVREAWLVDGYPYGMGRTDEEMVRDLEADTCPGFISDGLNRVMWTNAAYRRMASGKGGEKVLVVVEEGVALPIGSAAFTCRVRVVTCGKEKMCRTVPCDVWRMECGGIAWRLDTTAALSLWIGD